jgi:hypothetical protein
MYGFHTERLISAKSPLLLSSAEIKLVRKLKLNSGKRWDWNAKLLQKDMKISQLTGGKKF